MKLSIEATDKLENKDFHYELTVSKTHIVTIEVTELLQAFSFLRLVYIQEYLPVDNLTPYK